MSQHALYCARTVPALDSLCLCYSDLSFEFVRMLNLGLNMFRFICLWHDLSASGVINRFEKKEGEGYESGNKNNFLRH